MSKEALRLRRRAWQLASDDVSDGAGALVDLAAGQARRLQTPAAARTRPDFRRSALAALPRLRRALPAEGRG